MDKHPQKIKCRATSKTTGAPCSNWAVKGALVCRMHGAGKGSKAREKAASRIEQAEQVLREKLFEKHQAALDAIDDVLTDPQAKASDRLRAAEQIINRFVPTKAETKVTHEGDEARALDEEILEAAGIDLDEQDTQAG